VEGAVADGVDVVHQRLRRGPRKRQDLVGVDAEHQRHRVGFAERQTHEHLRRAAVRRVLRHVEARVVELAPRHVVAQRHPLIGEVGVHEGEVVALLVGAAIHRHRHPVAGAQEVVLRQLQRQVEAGQLRIPHAGGDTAGGGFLDRVNHVDLVVRAGDGRVLDFHLFEIPKP